MQQQPPINLSSLVYLNLAYRLALFAPRTHTTSLTGRPELSSSGNRNVEGGGGRR